jgi:hypothetical protein
VSFSPTRLPLLVSELILRFAIATSRLVRCQTSAPRDAYGGVVLAHREISHLDVRPDRELVSRNHDHALDDMGTAVVLESSRAAHSAQRSPVSGFRLCDQ